MKIVQLMVNDSGSQNYAYTEKLLGSQMSLVRVYFKKLEVVRYSTQENYSFIDLIGKMEKIISYTQLFVKMLYIISKIYAYFNKFYSIF